MLKETAQIYSKYQFFLCLLSNERLMLFQKNENDLDFELFFDNYNWVIYKHLQLKPIYRNFKSRRAQIIKKFNRGKFYILLRSRFCHDLTTVIIGFIL